MVTFNVDSLDFSDDEEVRVGANGDYGFSYDSGNDALEIEDRVNTAVSSVPRNVSTDLVGGKFAETVAEGKALADNGNVYDSIQEAQDNASSWVKVGPGTFNESVTIDTAGLTLEGSGERTEIVGFITLSQDNLHINSISIKSETNGIICSVATSGVVIDNVIIEIVGGRGIDMFGNPSYSTNSTITNCRITGGLTSIRVGENSIIYNNITSETAGQPQIFVGADDTIIANNNISESDEDAIFISSDNDCIVYANIISDSRTAIKVAGNDNIIAKNRLINNSLGINDEGTGTLLDSNLITE